MRKAAIAVGTFLTLVTVVGVVSVRATLGLMVCLTPFGVPAGGMAGIDWMPTVGKLVVSVNEPTGLPNNLDLVDSSGAHSPFSNLAGQTGEIKIATVQCSACQGGYLAGDTFAGNGVAGQIAKIAAGDTTAVNPWVTLPGETSPVSSLFQDHNCAFGGDLIVVTGREQSAGIPDDSLHGNVWRVTSAGVATLVATLDRHLEGVTTVPNDVAKYGPLAGRIIAGDEDRAFDGGGAPLNGGNGKIYGIGADGSVITIGSGAGVTYHVVQPINPEDLDIIPATGDFYGIDAGNNRILTASADQFAYNVGEILITTEYPDAASGQSGLLTLSWDAESGQFIVSQAIGMCETAGRWEHVTFTGPTCSNPGTPAIGIVKLTNGTNNDTGTGPFVAAGSTVTWTYNVTNTGDVALSNVTVTDDKVGFICTLPGTLAPGATGSCNKTGTAVAGQYSNVGTVTGTPPTGPAVTASNPDHYFGSSPAITIVKLTNGTNNDTGTGPQVAAGSTVTWTYNVTNTGNVALSNVTISDDKAGFVCTLPGTLAVGGSGSCTKTGVAVPGQYTNTGTVIGTSPTGATVTASNVDHYYGTCSGQIGNFVWKDLDGDGLQDVGEAGFPNVTVQLKQGSTILMTTTTDANGGYLFSNVCAGTYTVVVPTPPTGFTASPSNVGSDRTIDSNGSPATVTLTTSNSVDLTIDFGFGPLLATFTATQGGWGAPPSGNNPGALLLANFSRVYGTAGITIGATPKYYLKFTSQLAVQNFLPQGATPGVLKANATNPTTSNAGVFAGQVLALRISVDFSAAGVTKTGLGSKVLVSGKLAGKTVLQVLTIANTALGTGALPTGVTLSDLNNIVTLINQNYDGGTTNNGYLQ